MKPATLTPKEAVERAFAKTGMEGDVERNNVMLFLLMQDINKKAHKALKATSK